MTKKKIVVIASLVAVLTLTLTLFVIVAPEDTLAEEDIRAIIEERFTGEVREISASGKHYFVEFHSPFGVYAIEVDSDDGSIVAFEQTSQETEVTEWKGDAESVELLTLEDIRGIIEETLDETATLVEAHLEEDGETYYTVQVDYSAGKGTFEIDAVTGEVLLYTIEDNLPVEPITEQEAIDIALTQHDGDVDDVDLEEKDGKLVYDIEIENEVTGKDADIIIDAYTGEVLSVEFD